MTPGVYFGMPADEYHAIDAVGSSALRDMLISPLDCWARHVNPNRRERQDTAAQLRGSAFHAALLEGMEAFKSRYYPELNREAFPDALWSGDELREECGARHLPRGGTKMDQALRLSRAGFPAERIGPYIEINYEHENRGKTELPHEDWDRIIEAHAVMEQAGIAKAFSGGQPEVTIVYQCELTGLLRKARIDYLKPAAAFDLKTISNKNGKDWPTNVAHAFVMARHHVQAVDYWHAIEQAKRQNLPPFATGGFVDVMMNGFHASKPHDYFMVYRQAGEVPNVAVRRVAPKTAGMTNAYWRAAEEDRARALKEYKRHLDEFGKEQPWASAVAIEDFDDTALPGYLIGA